MNGNTRMPDGDSFRFDTAAHRHIRADELRPGDWYRHPGDLPWQRLVLLRALSVRGNAGRSVAVEEWDTGDQTVAMVRFRSGQILLLLKREELEPGRSGLTPGPGWETRGRSTDFSPAKEVVSRRPRPPTRAQQKLIEQFGLDVEEARAVTALQRLAAKWPESLRLVSGEGSFRVIRIVEERHISEGLDVRRKTVIAELGGIPNDGGA